MQEIILPGLAETNFFDNNVFLGGTALRMLYGLKRYSEDLDFTMKYNKINEFSWKPFIDNLFKYGNKYGMDFTSKEENDKFGNKILRIRSDSLLEMIHDKGIVPFEFTEKGKI
jgi:predicted nucleotidyltransferase component of viral defense system